MSPFELLGLSRNCTIDELKQRFRRLAIKHHPDKGGDAEKFAELRAAYDKVLIDLEAPQPCPCCKTTGKVVVANGFSSIQVPCAYCDGTGFLS